MQNASRRYDLKGRPKDTLKIMRNLWLQTGDIGKFDEQGFFYFVDRRKDFLHRRDENISSFEMRPPSLATPPWPKSPRTPSRPTRGEDDVKMTAMLRHGMALAPEDLFRWAIDAPSHIALCRAT
ncbi:hypothetical protein [Comamonas thiooxydans]|uniref:hypothetical protein n=1 Tax=Comamonas thiooxydans TaxID=363952 RepID=UPI001A94D7B1|nr:hypothetical protein [Comamonas thiooxydans]